MQMSMSFLQWLHWLCKSTLQFKRMFNIKQPSLYWLSNSLEQLFGLYPANGRSKDFFFIYIKHNSSMGMISLNTVWASRHKGN